MEDKNIQNDPGRSKLLMSILLKEIVFLVIVPAIIIISSHIIVRVSESSPTIPISAECQRVIVPAYFYPGDIWDRAISTLSKGDIAIFNPASGAGKEVNKDYSEMIRKAKRKDLDLLGYVYVDYNKRDIDSVKAEIDNYFDWYGVSSIFLDGVSSDKDDIVYYSDLYSYIRSRGGRTVLNPGTIPDEEYMAAADQVIVTEGKYADYPKREFPEWISRYPSDKFAHLIYETPKESLSQAISSAKSRNAGYIYITDDGGSNAWDTLPTYWQEELSLKCPGYKKTDDVSIGARVVSGARYVVASWEDLTESAGNILRR